jgi:hypothetical protein
MSQLLALSPQNLAGKFWRRPSGFLFAADRQVIPLVGAELAKASVSMPLGFVQAGDVYVLVAFTSPTPGNNLYIGPDGKWLGNYVPAALRAHPFHLVSPTPGAEAVLCIDESAGVITDSPEGAEPFFDETGKPTQPILDTLNFLAQTEQNRVATQLAVNAVVAAGLMQPWPISVQSGEQQVPVNGLFRVDEAKLNALSGEEFLKLRAASALPLVYAQLLSINQLALLERLATIQRDLALQHQQLSQPLGNLGGFTLGDDGDLKFH